MGGPELSLARSALVTLGFAAISLAGCVTAKEDARVSAPAPDVISQIHEVDLSPRFPQRATPIDAIGPAGGTRAETYYGDGSPGTAGKRPRPGKAEPDDGPTTTGALTDGTAPAGRPAYEM